MANHPTLDSQLISQISKKESQLPGGSTEPARGGPTAAAQKHAGEELDANTLSDITKGEKKVTGGERVKAGPTAAAQSILTKSNQTATATTAAGETSSASDGVMHGDTVSNITHAETNITGDSRPVAGGPTAQAQKHVGEAINADVLHDISKGEQKVSGVSDRILPGGPTAQAQHDLAKSRE